MSSTTLNNNAISKIKKIKTKTKLATLKRITNETRHVRNETSRSIKIRPSTATQQNGHPDRHHQRELMVLQGGLRFLDVSRRHRHTGSGASVTHFRYLLRTYLGGGELLCPLWQRFSISSMRSIYVIGL